MKYRAPCFLMLLALTGCGVSPEPDYYTLAAVPGVASPEVRMTVKIERPIIPAYLDRPDIVRQSGAYRIDIDEARRWAAPFDEMLERVLAGDLRQRLPNSSVATDEDDTPVSNGFIVVTDIENFNRTDEGAVLDAQITLTGRGDCARNPETLPFHAASTDGGPAGLSALAGQLADRIETALQRSPIVKGKPC